MTDFRPYELRVPVEMTFDATIGFILHDSDEIGRCSGRLPVRPQVCQPFGMIHGGVYAAIAETLASAGTARGVMAAGGIPLGMSNNTSFLRPITEGTVQGVAVAIHRGRTSWVWDVEMRDDHDRLCATSRVTIAVRRSDQMREGAGPSAVPSEEIPGTRDDPSSA
jgi:uncharacterized protein (TIGR00369 family)